MQSLPTALTSGQLDALLQTIASLPSAEVTRHADIVVVHATKKSNGQRVKVFSAATSDGARWHAMAVPGLISRV